MTTPLAPPPLPAGTLSPLAPRHLVDLFFRPARFFDGRLALGARPYVLLVTWCYGMTQAGDRIEQNLMRADFARQRPVWKAIAPYINESWIGFWVYVALAGAVGAVTHWWLAGWWYAVRIRWSGQPTPDRRAARLVLVYSGFVIAGPNVLAYAAYSALFPDYQAVWNSTAPWVPLASLALVALAAWSVFTSYVGVRTVFGLRGWRVQALFLILPLLLIVVGMGGIFALYYRYFVPDGAPI